MINQVVLVGRITKDLTLSQGTNGGKPFCRFTLAVNRTYTNAQNEREADFPQLKVFGKQAENLVKFMKKGSLIGVTASIRTGSFVQNGETKYTTDIVCDDIQFLEPRSQNQNSNEQSQPSTYNQQQPNYNQPPSQQWNAGNNQQPPQYNQGQYQQPPVNNGAGQQTYGYPPSQASNQSQPPQYSHAGGSNWNSDATGDDLPF